MPAFDLEAQSASLQIVINPLVDWVWFGFGVIALGTGIALLPERSYSFALAKMPGEAAPGSVALLLALLLTTASVAAQHVESPQNVPVIPRSALEKQMQREIICLCGISDGDSAAAGDPELEERSEAGQGLGR
jgi:hypothetical protein